MAQMTKPWDNGPLRVSENHRYFQNGTVPFLWIGDTAWLLFQKLDLDEAYRYLKNRKDKQFNVIQCVLIHHAGMKNVHGSPALVDDDFLKPDLEHDYWEHADRIIDMAADLGLYMGILPIWGSMAKQFPNVEAAASYAAFVANRYKDRPNIIWINGGDTKGVDNLDIWNTMGRIYKTTCPDKLVCFHAFGRMSSSEWFAQEDWLDFNMFQSGHRRYDQIALNAWDDNAKAPYQFGEDNWRYVLRDHDRVAKPTLDGEPSYEQIVQGLHDITQPYWQACDVRRYAYWAVFSGAAGHTYGDNSIMQFFADGEANGAFGVHQRWYTAMHNPGAGQMMHLYNLVNRFDFVSGQVRDDLLADGQQEKYGRIAAFAGTDFALFYNYSGRSFQVDTKKLPDTLTGAWWFDPADGVYSYLGRVEKNAVMTFIPPQKPEGQNDWVLVLAAE